MSNANATDNGAAPFQPYTAKWTGPDTPLAVLKKDSDVVVVAPGQVHVPGLPGLWTLNPATQELIAPQLVPTDPSSSALPDPSQIDQAFIEAALANENVLKIIASVVKADPAKGQAVVAAVMAS